MDSAGLAASPFPSEHLEFECVDELSFTQRRQKESRLILGQQSGSRRMSVLAVKRYEKSGVGVGNQ